MSFEEDPLPLGRLSVLSVILLSTNICSWVIYPMLPFLVMHYDPSISTVEVSYRCGILGSSYYLGGFIASFFWGLAADTVGRRRCLIAGLIGTGFFAIALGMTNSFYVALFCRFFWGIMNGNAGVVKTYCGEILSAKNQARGMSIFGIVGGMGRFIGPALGGFLCVTPQPILNIAPFFYEFPYLLPNLICGSFCFLIAFFTACMIDETLPNALSWCDALTLLCGCHSKRMIDNLSSPNSVHATDDNCCCCIVPSCCFCSPCCEDNILRDHKSNEYEIDITPNALRRHNTLNNTSVIEGEFPSIPDPSTPISPSHLYHTFNANNTSNINNNTVNNITSAQLNSTHTLSPFVSISSRFPVSSRVIDASNYYRNYHNLNDKNGPEVELSQILDGNPNQIFVSAMHDKTSTSIENLFLQRRFVNSSPFDAIQNANIGNSNRIDSQSTRNNRSSKEIIDFKVEDTSNLQQKYITNNIQSSGSSHTKILFSPHSSRSTNLKLTSPYHVIRSVSNIPLGDVTAGISYQVAHSNSHNAQLNIIQQQHLSSKRITTNSSLRSHTSNNNNNSLRRTDTFPSPNSLNELEKSKHQPNSLNKNNTAQSSKRKNSFLSPNMANVHYLNSYQHQNQNHPPSSSMNNPHFRVGSEVDHLPCMTYRRYLYPHLLASAIQNMNSQQQHTQQKAQGDIGNSSGSHNPTHNVRNGTSYFSESPNFQRDQDTGSSSVANRVEMQSFKGLFAGNQVVSGIFASIEEEIDEGATDVNVFDSLNMSKSLNPQQDAEEFKHNSNNVDYHLSTPSLKSKFVKPAATDNNNNSINKSNDQKQQPSFLDFTSKSKSSLIKSPNRLLFFPIASNPQQAADLGLTPPHLPPSPHSRSIGNESDSLLALLARSTASAHQDALTNNELPVIILSPSQSRWNQKVDATQQGLNVANNNNRIKDYNEGFEDAPPQLSNHDDRWTLDEIVPFIAPPPVLHVDLRFPSANHARDSRRVSALPGDFQGAESEPSSAPISVFRQILYSSLPQNSPDLEEGLMSNQNHNRRIIKGSNQEIEMNEITTNDKDNEAKGYEDNESVYGEESLGCSLSLLFCGSPVPIIEFPEFRESFQTDNSDDDDDDLDNKNDESLLISKEIDTELNDHTRKSNENIKYTNNNFRASNEVDLGNQSVEVIDKHVNSDLLVIEETPRSIIEVQRLPSYRSNTLSSSKHQYEFENSIIDINSRSKNNSISFSDVHHRNEINNFFYDKNLKTVAITNQLNNDGEDKSYQDLHLTYWDSIWQNRDFRVSCWIFFLTSFSQVMGKESFSVMVIGDESTGGLHFTPADIGTVMMFASPFPIITQLLFVPCLSTYLGIRKALSWSCMVWALAALTTPYINQFRDPQTLGDRPTDWTTWTLIIARVAIMETVGVFSYTFVACFMNNTCRTNVRGVFNGVGGAFCNFARLCGPIGGGAILALTTSGDYVWPFNYHCVWIVCSLASLSAWIIGLCMADDSVNIPLEARLGIGRGILFGERRQIGFKQP